MKTPIRATAAGVNPPRAPTAETRLRAAILRWYLRCRRDLPWRRTRDPYAIWVSEIMLQQTRVEAAIPYYERFLQRFPDLRSLARAPEPRVLAAWSGLGYYSRARNLRVAARVMVREHAGRVPRSQEALRALPGIGPYTAAAIASIAHGVPAAAVDGNVIRVLARIAGLSGRRSSPRLRAGVTALAEGLAVGPRPGDWTQALMELGATVCLPRDPLCPSCPVARHCRAKHSGRPDRFPEPARAAPRGSSRSVLLIARRGREVLLLPDTADNGATWTVPRAAVGRAGAWAAVRSLARRFALEVDASGGASWEIRHQTYAGATTFEVWPAQAAKRKQASHSAPPARWFGMTAIAKLPMRAPSLKAILRSNEPPRARRKSPHRGILVRKPLSRTAHNS